MRIAVSKADLPEVVGLSYPAVRRLVAAGQFPPPRQLSPGRVGWLLSELQAWASTRPISSGKLRGESTRAANLKKRELANETP